MVGYVPDSREEPTYVKFRRIRTNLIVGVACAALTAAGIGATALAKSKSSHKRHSANTAAPARQPGGPHGGPAVHADEVVLNKAGTAFITETEDSGTVTSVSGDQLTIKEAADNVTYKTVTLTIPADATVNRNGAKAALSDLKTGDHVHVSSSSDGTTVFAGDSSFGPGGPGHGGPPGAPGHGGPGGPPPGYGG
jgi:hypothetical protein